MDKTPVLRRIEEQDGDRGFGRRFSPLMALNLHPLSGSGTQLLQTDCHQARIDHLTF
jgi:hypothetical protein